MLIGDTTYDILMARAAGAVPVGVELGQSRAATSCTAAGAVRVLDRFEELNELLT